MLPVFLEHNPEKIIGLILDIQIDKVGVKFILGVWEKVEQYRLSVGFITIQKSFKNNVRILLNIDLKEVSLVHFPSQKGTICKKKYLQKNR